MVSSSTRLTGLFGHPVAHSKSPQMHNAAFAHLGLDYVYLAFDIPPEAIEQGVQSIRALNLRGVNVTIPHKVAVLPFLDELSDAARRIGAVNTIVHEQGRLIGHNTDGIGYLAALREETGFTPAGQSVLLLGAGGAARAVATQLALDGAAQITIAARAVAKAAELLAPLESLTAADAVSLSGVVPAEYDLVVNTTPIGMHPQVDELPIDPNLLRAGQWVSDLIYNPRQTRFLQEAAARGCLVSGGLGMFIHQGAEAFRLWTGHPAPTDVMRKTVESYL
ncbi:shikimate dehydrogenase [Tumebacillus permanentifrigoris]|uniref:Shikimate dehydrogenase (NADP(+)) n=1 Tax=Tumebacillus permanentifrigoris TaxID=378543 RepID=A0A316DE92_9BACL|nr:shikimate dehydrogenase [Tumebacillus permanentifrigoris]PWK16026.1 shikimate dehydrogenase [Tumebacillus permanentifrigoris]